MAKLMDILSNAFANIAFGKGIKETNKAFKDYEKSLTNFINTQDKDLLNDFRKFYGGTKQEILQNIEKGYIKDRHISDLKRTINMHKSSTGDYGNKLYKHAKLVMDTYEEYHTV